MYLFVLSFCLALATTTVIHNTITYRVTSDADRYIAGIQSGEEESLGAQLLIPLTYGGTDDFITKSNFLFILAIGYLIYSSTNSWKFTIAALIGFSVSFILYFSIVAQAFVVVLALFLWTKINPFDAKHIIKNNAIFLVTALLMLLTHRYGLILAAFIYLVKAIRFDEGEKWRKAATNLMWFSYVIAGALLAYITVNNVQQVTFFYHFLLPMPMGLLDKVFWYGLFGLIFWLLTKCQNNTRELVLVSLCLFSTVATYFLSGLEIDFWRVLFFAELIAWIKIGQEKTEDKSIIWLPWFLLAMSVERLLLGLLR